MHELYNHIGTNVSDLLKTTEILHPSVTNRNAKVKSKKLANLLFQLLPAKNDNTR